MPSDAEMNHLVQGLSLGPLDQAVSALLNLRPKDIGTGNSALMTPASLKSLASRFEGHPQAQAHIKSLLPRSPWRRSG